MDSGTVTIFTESDTGRGWSYEVELVHPDGTATHHRVDLAWVDHDHWSGGRRSPSVVVQAILEWVLAQGDRRLLPARFDASTLRRWYPDLDGALVGLV